MRLLDARALIHEGVSRLVDDAEVGKPYFAILSHTWGREEVLFEDIALGPNHEVDSLTEEQRATRGNHLGSRIMHNCDFRFKWFRQNEEDSSPHGVCESCRPRNQSIIRQQGSHIKAGWKKIWSVCLQACRDGYDYVWVDTCCIDKSSSTELAEALNSMFEWYAVSSICYVLLEDCRLCPRRVTAQHGIFDFLHPIDRCTEAQISHCRWLSRGWTLQELIAPSEIKFFDQVWTILGTRSNLADILSNITSIDGLILSNPPLISFNGRSAEIRQKLYTFSVATKMSWAANRQTTRAEDRAYSLLGLFGVNIPLLYGEGDKAFLRLQEEIIRHSNDDSIFAWEFTDDVEYELYKNQLLAPSPDYFSWWSPQKSRNLRLYSSATDLEEVNFDERFEITQKALHITVPLFHWRKEDKSNAKTTSRKKNRSIYEIHFQGTLQGCDLGRKPPEDHTSESKFSVNFKTSQALLKCHLGFGMSSLIRIALRLSHTYLGDRHISSQVVSEQPGRNELEEDIRHRMGSRLGKRHRLALYLGDPVTTTRQSIVIQRDGDINNI